ncbi:hypothetical protein [Chitinophaga nivalis]|uniref:DUF3575 domain-containing protein n=1 Tax=Chitinophaga nivalis TaxID=2991709 RepID=A0ABT3IUQ6_9BACT|nr:hypothetical protein [Chitinophaga nivalis]MCW3462639.1 hypothetical protein [Chitinophaga nivalis]MCW3487670.1 hypothetical protein [Chitinophaga nivalis]
MKKTLLLTWLFCAVTFASFAQDPPKSKGRNTYLKVNPTTLINELDIYLEQEITDKISIELGVSGIYTDYPDYVLAKKIDIGQKKPDISTEQFVNARGLGFRAGLRWYLISRETGPSSAAGTYFEPVLFYKRVFYPNEDIVNNNTTYTSSADKNVFGFQLLLGRQFRKDKFILDPFIGLGLRSKIYQYKTYHQEVNGVSVNDGRMVSVLPSLHIGIKLGLKLR